MNFRTSMTIAAALLAAAPLADASQNLREHETIAADATIDVSNVAGRVNVTAWDRNEIELTATLESDEDKLEFEATERKVRIKVVTKDHYFDHEEHDAYLTLKIPKGARISAETVSADINVVGVLGEQRLETVSGEIETQAFDAPVKLNTVSGDGTIIGNGGKAMVSVETISGAVSASGVRGSYDGEVVSGTLTVDLAAAERLHAKSISGDIDARAELMAGARVELETVSGTVGLTIKPPVNAEFDLESFSGDIENCFGQKSQDKDRYGPGSELNFTQGNGSARVSIDSLSGDIKVCDHRR